MTFEEKLNTVLPAIERNYQIQAAYELERRFINVINENGDVNTSVVKDRLEYALVEWAGTVTIFANAGGDHLDLLNLLPVMLLPAEKKGSPVVFAHHGEHDVVRSSSFSLLMAGAYPATFARYPDNVTNEQVEYFYHVHQVANPGKTTKPQENSTPAQTVTVEKILKHRPEFTFFIRRLPVRAHYLDEPIYWYAGLVPNTFMALIDKDGVDIDLFAKEMPWFPIERADKDEMSGLLKLNQLLNSISDDTLEDYVQMVEDYAYGAQHSYEPSTECTNAELPVVVIRKSIAQLYRNNLFNAKGLKEWGKANNVGVWYDSARNRLKVYLYRATSPHLPFVFIPGMEAFTIENPGTFIDPQTVDRIMTVIRKLNAALESDEIPSIAQPVKG